RSAPASERAFPRATTKSPGPTTPAPNACATVRAAALGRAPTIHVAGSARTEDAVASPGNCIGSAYERKAACAGAALRSSAAASGARTVRRRTGRTNTLAGRMERIFRSRRPQELRRGPVALLAVFLLQRREQHQHGLGADLVAPFQRAARVVE